MSRYSRFAGSWKGCLLAMAAWSLVMPGSDLVVAQDNGGDSSVRRGRTRRPGAVEFITIDVREKDLRDVLQGIGRQVDINLIADPEVDEKVTMSHGGSA